MNAKLKKEAQLGMNPSTASGRLVKDILFKLVQETDRDTCFRCNEKMAREDFSIEHKIAWLDSTDPQQLYFDLDNISFSHISCNVKAGKRCVKYPNEEERKKGRYAQTTEWKRKNLVYSPEARREKYLVKGN